MLHQGTTVVWLLLATAATTAAHNCVISIDDPDKTDCSNLGLTSVPSDLPNNTRYLILSDNNIHQLVANQFSGLSNLSVVEIDNNMLTTVNESAFNSCMNLASVSLRVNNISALDKATFTPLSASLKALWLASNRMATVPEAALSGLTMLNTLDLSYLNGLSAVSDIETYRFGDVFKQLPLTTLLAQGLGFKNLSRDVFANINTNLTTLDLSSNKLTCLDNDTLSSFQHLQSLRLYGNALTTLNTQILRNLSELQELDVGMNDIDVIPEMLCQYTPKLTTLGFDGFKGSRLNDDDLDSCAQLMSVVMTFTMLSDVGKAFANLTQLTSLNLSNNPQLSITDANAFVNASRLQSVNLHGMGTKLSGNFYSLPAALTSLRNHTNMSLDVSYSRFSTFSKSDQQWIDASVSNLSASHNPYDCTCRNIDFVTWFQRAPAAITDDVSDYNCSSCDECQSLPTPLTTFSLDHCTVTNKQEHDKVLRYALGLTFAGIIVGVLMTSCVVYILTKRRAACFRTPYSSMDSTSTNA